METEKEIMTKEEFSEEIRTEEPEEVTEEPEEVTENIADAGTQPAEAPASDGNAGQTEETPEALSRNEESVRTAEKAEKPEISEIPDKAENNGRAEKSDSADRRLFIVRVAAVAVAVLGIIMLVSGMVLHRLDEESRKTPGKAQMPQEYIEEFFSDDSRDYDIEKYLEPEA